MPGDPHFSPYKLFVGLSLLVWRPLLSAEAALGTWGSLSRLAWPPRLLNKEKTVLLARPLSYNLSYEFIDNLSTLGI
jgi:hypothetical protein